MIPRSSKTLKTSVGPRQERRRLTAFNSTLESDDFFSNDYVSDQLSSRSEEDDTGGECSTPSTADFHHSPLVHSHFFDAANVSDIRFNLDIPHNSDFLDFDWSLSNSLYPTLRPINELGFDDNTFDDLLEFVENDSDDEHEEFPLCSKADSQLKQSIVDWHLECRINGAHSTKLLQLLKKYGLTFLPNDIRSLIKSMRKVETKVMSPGNYYHFGLKACLQHILTLRAKRGPLPSSVSIATNVDGSPCTNSSASEFWPISCKILHLEYSQPFLVGIYHGPRKPESANEFLHYFVEEAIELEREGLFINGNKIYVLFTLFCCDAPALAFILYVKYHTGYFSCLYCFTQGQSFKTSRESKGRIVFPQIDAPIRTDTSFRGNFQSQHHSKKGTSILEKLNIHMIHCFPPDPFHLLDLGLMRQILVNLFVHCPTKGVKLSAEVIDSIDNRLLVFKRNNVITDDFQRVPRSLTDLGRWKGTELKQFRKHTGPVLLRGYLNKPLYENFLNFHVATKLLDDPESVTDPDTINLCEKLLINCASDAIDLYGLQFLANNAHKIIHLPRFGAAIHGTLESWSSYDFENLLQIIKNLVVKTQKPLQQVVKRSNEWKQHSS